MANNRHFSKTKKVLWSIRSSLTLFILALVIGSGLITAAIASIVYKFVPIIQTNTNIAFVLLAILFSIVLTALLATFLTKRWLKTANKLQMALEQIANGNFDVHVETKGHRGEFKAAIESFNKMAEELSHLEIYRNDFINYFSHEFKTPIVSISGFAKQLQSNENLTEEEKKEYLSIIVTECTRLTQMSTNILLLNRLENQEIVTDQKTFSLDEQIRSALVLLEKEWEDKNISLNLEMDEVNYTFNEEMLYKVWLNLLSNAIKFTPKDGSIEIILDEDVDGVHVEMTDSGVGMSKDVIPHIFEKFYQADTSHKAKGNGLGLPLVKRIIDLCHGTISVSSIEGSGSTFTIFLPKN